MLKFNLKSAKIPTVILPNVLCVCLTTDNKLANNIKLYHVQVMSVLQFYIIKKMREDTDTFYFLAQFSYGA